MLINELLKGFIKEAQTYYLPSNNTLWVSMLIQCPYKFRLLREIPSLKALIQLQSNVLIGNLIHKGIEYYIAKFDIGIGERYVRIEKNVDGNHYTITGRVDVVDNNYCYEIKTINTVINDYRIPLRPHIEQLLFYLYMLNKEFNEGEKDYVFIKYSLGYLVYIDLGKYTIKEIEVRFNDYAYNKVDEIIDDRIRNFVKMEKIPLYDGECNYCLFKSWCKYYKR